MKICHWEYGSGKNTLKCNRLQTNMINEKSNRKKRNLVIIIVKSTYLCKKKKKVLNIAWAAGILSYENSLLCDFSYNTKCVGSGETKTEGIHTCGTSEYLYLEKCAFSIKALDFSLGHSGGYTPLPWLARNVPLIIIKDLASRPLLWGTPSESDGISRDSQ